MELKTQRIFNLQTSPVKNQARVGPFPAPDVLHLEKALLNTWSA